VQQALRRRKATQAEQAIERIASRLEPQLRKRFLAAVQSIKDKVDLNALAQAVQSSSISQAELAIKISDWDTKYGVMAIDLKAGFLAGGEVAYHALDGAGFKLRFDLINPYAVNYASRKLPQLTQSYKENARGMIRDIITEAVAGNHTAQTAAKAIRDHVGLTDAYSKAVTNYRAELIGSGITGDKLDGKVQRYSDQLLRSRAKTIARTEIIQAQVAGQRALWNEAAREGLFDKTRMKRVWVTSFDERTCGLCVDMDGQEVAFNGVYESPDLGNVNVFGEVLNGPPMHPNCRCREKLESGVVSNQSDATDQIDATDAARQVLAGDLTSDEFMGLVRDGTFDKEELRRLIQAGEIGGALATEIERWMNE
jgi:hypothetical protein